MTYNPLDHIPLTHWLLLGPLLIAAYTDTRYGLIYNGLTFPTALAGLATSAWLGGWTGLLWAAVGLAGGFVLLLPGYALGGMAAGDVKLMAAIGAWIGWPAVLLATVYSLMIGGLLGLLHAARHGVLLPILRRLWRMLVSVAVPGLKAEVDFARSEAPPFVYGPALVLGTLVWMATSGQWRF